MSNLTMNWFVAADANLGDGSREKPFHDPWLALRVAGPGDNIHIATGIYFGRYDRSSWTIDRPGLTLLGGYTRDFSQRTPWQTPSVFAVFPGYEATRENNLVSGRGDHSRLTLDGLFFDAAGRNIYGDKPTEELRSYPTMEGPIASFNAKEVTIRNCVFTNCTAGGVELSGDSSRFENNLVMNILGVGMLDLRSTAESSQPIVVQNNTFCFAHDAGPPCGAGADFALGIRVNRSAIISDNVFLSCGNAAISLYRDLDRVSVDRNLFYLTSRDLIVSRAQGNTAVITEKNIDELEDVGFKSAVDNVVQDPGLGGLRTEWLDAYSRHLLANYIKPSRDAVNALRAGAGLPTLTPADLEKEEDKGGFAPRLSSSDVLAFRVQAKQGYHPVALVTEIGAEPEKTKPSYQPVDWTVIDAPDASLSNTRVELQCGIGLEQNATLLADADSSTHMGIRVHRPFSDEGSIFVLAKRNTLPARQFEEATKYNNGREAEITYLLRGVYRTDVEATSRQKVTLVLDSIAPAPFLTKEPAPRPQGRDWFVRAGASGGDGTQAKPFRDPFQALDKAEGGDSIHVATGSYYGKLKSGKWKISIRNLALLGGYDAEFRARDPWKNPTRFVLDEEERAKGVPEGTVLASEENSDGLILDGFFFDGAAYNGYVASGALDLRQSPLSPLVSLRGGGAPITVRNCIFLNASGAAISISSSCGVLENNIILNTSGWALTIRADGPGPWFVRNNTLLFASDPTARAGTGRSSSNGILFHLTGRAVAVVEANIFAFADNIGLRSTIAQPNISCNKNAFAANLYMHLSDAQYLWADSSTWKRRAEADSAFASFQENSLELPLLPVDAKFADAALTRLFSIPSRISAEQWKTYAEQVGSSVRPSVKEETPAPEATPPKEEPAKASAPQQTSINDILAGLSSMKTELKELATPKKSDAVVEPVYCPAFPWEKAVALAADVSSNGPGAKKVNLSVSFAAPRAQESIQYARVTPETIDADYASLDNKAVELEVTKARSSASNPSVFPTGATSDNYVAYFVSTVGDSTRVPLAILVRLDTAASKLLDRTAPTDTLRICGTARIPGNPSMLSILVDRAESVGS